MFAIIRRIPPTMRTSTFLTRMILLNQLEPLDLGVTMSNSCDFNAHNHIDKTVKTCSRLVGWILRTFTTLIAPQC